MRYNDYFYIYPPRPKNPMDPKDLGEWENTGMVAQPKFNGSNCIMFINENQRYIMNRHGQRLTNYQLPKEEVDRLYDPIGKGWLVLNGEYMNKSKSDENGQVFNHKFVIFDILVHSSEYLVRTTFKDRIELLDQLYGTQECSKDYLYQYSDDVYRVKTYKDNFVDVYKKLSPIDMIEGLVCKRANARLEIGVTESNNTKSQIKFRKPNKNYKY